MKIFFLVLLLTIISSSLFADVIDRGLEAERKCTPNALATATFEPADAGMESHYKPSNLQRVLTPVYTTIIDDFGGVIQSLLSGEDEYQVDYTLKRLGRLAGRAPLSKSQKICMMTCMINELMESDDEVIPTTSMTLAVARGKGFCRHFALASQKMFQAAGIAAKTEEAIDHMFLKVTLNGKLYYSDTGNQDGVSECNFIPAK